MVNEDVNCGKTTSPLSQNTAVCASPTVYLNLNQIVYLNLSESSRKSGMAIRVLPILESDGVHLPYPSVVTRTVRPYVLASRQNFDSTQRNHLAMQPS